MVVFVDVFTPEMHPRFRSKVSAPFFSAFSDALVSREIASAYTNSPEPRSNPGVEFRLGKYHNSRMRISRRWLLAVTEVLGRM